MTDLVALCSPPPADQRPVLLGMNNPLSERPEHALYPHPPGCTGWWLWSMLNEKTGASKSQYLRVFDRRNVLRGPWDRGRAREAARDLVRALAGREVLMLGEEVRAAIGVPKLLLHPQEAHGVTWRQLPHPSGRNLWYNDVESRSLAGDLLAELYRSVELREYN